MKCENPQCQKDISHLTKTTKAANGRRVERRFCDRSCAASYNNRKFPKRGKKPKPPKAPCARPSCHQPAWIKYCSNTCAAAHREEIRIQAWLNGDLTKAVKSTSTWILAACIRRWLRQRANEQCELCGWHEVNPALGYSPLEIDHIDGNWHNPHPDNLRVLCPNCHALQPTYRNLNAGNNKAAFHKNYYNVNLQKQQALHDDIDS